MFIVCGNFSIHINDDIYNMMVFQVQLVHFNYTYSLIYPMSLTGYRTKESPCKVSCQLVKNRGC